jgi:uncharacterized protein (TIGR02117 family)
MKFFWKILRSILKFFSGIVVAVILYVICAAIGSLIPVNTSFKNSEQGVEIFILSNGVHTGFVLPVNGRQINWPEICPYSDFPFADSTFEYIGFGWGDKEFYIETESWSDLKFSTAFKALFWLGEGAMHVTYIRSKPAENDRCRKIILSYRQYEALTRYISDSFEKDPDGQVILIDAPGYGRTDKFYESLQSYSFLRTCNIWTNTGLKEINVRTALWSPFEFGIMYQLP